MKETYLLRPLELEIFEVDNGTDIILRRNIEQVEQSQMDGEPDSLVWRCDEKQVRYHGEITSGDITDNLDYWWTLTEAHVFPETEEPVDSVNEVIATPDALERLTALEDAFAEFVEVMING